MDFISDTDKIRLDFPALQTKINGYPLIYLDNAATTQKPKCVLDKIISFYSESNSNIHRANHYLGEKASFLYESARETVKNFIGARNSYEIIFTSGTTASINLVAQAFGYSQIRQGDEIIITEMEHHSNLLPWQLLCQSKEATLKILFFDDNGTLKINSLNNILTEKTKLIAITHISNATGVVNPIKEIISFAHSAGIPVLVDGAQSISHQPVNVVDLDCDFFVFSGHKMYAETGIGVLYGKEKWLDLMPVWQTGGGMVSFVDFHNAVYSELPFKFEAGTPNIAGAISLAEAIKYLECIGINSILSYEKNLLQYTLESLSEFKEITLYAKNAEKSGLLSFNINNVSPIDASLILDKLGIAVRSGTHCAQLVMKHFGIKSTIRVSYAIYNRFEDIDLLVSGIQKVLQILR